MSVDFEQYSFSYWENNPEVSAMIGFVFSGYAASKTRLEVHPNCTTNSCILL